MKNYTTSHKWNPGARPSSEEDSDGLVISSDYMNTHLPEEPLKKCCEHHITREEDNI